MISGDVLELSHVDEPRIVDVLCEAFYDYPVMRFVIGECGDDYARRLHKLVRFFVTARTLRGEPLLGVEEDGHLLAAAIVSFPGSGSESARVGAHPRRGVEGPRPRGNGALQRVRRGVGAFRGVGAASPSQHDRCASHAQGRGYARLLLDRVHRMSVEREGSKGVSLTTEDPANVALYRNAGYEIVGHARISSELETWGFFRWD